HACTHTNTHTQAHTHTHTHMRTHTHTHAHTHTHTVASLTLTVCERYESAMIRLLEPVTNVKQKEIDADALTFLQRILSCVSCRSSYRSPGHTIRMVPYRLSTDAHIIIKLCVET